MNITKTRQCSLCQSKLSKGDFYYINYYCNHTYCYSCVQQIELPDKVRHKCFVKQCNNYVNLIKMDEEFIQQQLQMIQIQDNEEKKQELMIQEQIKQEMKMKFSDYCGFCFMYKPEYFEYQKNCKYHKLCFICQEENQQCRLCLC